MRSRWVSLQVTIAQLISWIRGVIIEEEAAAATDYSLCSFHRISGNSKLFIRFDKRISSHRTLRKHNVGLLMRFCAYVNENITTHRRPEPVAPMRMTLLAFFLWPLKTIEWKKGKKLHNNSRVTMWAREGLINWSCALDVSFWKSHERDSYWRHNQNPNQLNLMIYLRYRSASASILVVCTVSLVRAQQWVPLYTNILCQEPANIISVCSCRCSPHHILAIIILSIQIAGDFFFYSIPCKMIDSRLCCGR